MRQLFLDTETTGLKAHDRIIEIAIVEVIDRKMTGNDLHAYVNPGIASHPDALRVHGLGDDFIAMHEPFTAICERVLGFIGDSEVFAHNARFDAGMLAKEGVTTPVTDTLAMARGLWPKQVCALGALAARYGVPQRLGALHGAMMDAQVLVGVYLAMTRAQDVLDMTQEPLATPAAQAKLIDPGLVIFATPEERKDHDACVPR